MTNLTFAAQALKFWYDALPFPARVKPWGETIAAYQAQGTFLDQFGAAIRSIPQPKVKAAMVKLAASGAGMPHKTEFFDALAQEAGSLNAEDYKQVAVDTVKDVGSFAGKGLMLYAGLALAVVALPYLLKAFKK